MTRVPLITDQAGLERAGIEPSARDNLAWIAGSRGEVTRPFAVLLHRPELARKVAELGATLRFDGHLRDDHRELAILATGCAHRCEFEWRSHRDIALAAGVRPDAVAALRADADLSAFVGDEMVLVAFAREFVATSSVADATFDAAHGLLGTAGVVELAAIVGYYSLMASVLNICAPTTPARPILS